MKPRPRNRLRIHTSRQAAAGARRSPARAAPWVLVAVLLVLHCGCGRSPTEPDPPPPPDQGSLFGSWQGSMDGIRTSDGTTVSCGLTWELEDAGSEPGVQVGLGTWQATCADGSSGGGVLNVNEVLFLVTVLGLPVGGSSPPFEGCGWGGTGTRTAARIEGAWETAEGEGCPAAITGIFTVQR